MKKILAFVLVLILILSTFSGCGIFGLANRLFGAGEVYVDEPYTEPVNYTYPDIEDYTIEYPTEEDTQVQTNAPEVYVRPAEWASVQWQPYSNEYFTLNIPAGWQVEYQGDANQLYWIAHNADKTVGMTNLDHAYAAKDASMKDVLGFGMSLSNGTVQEYFETLFAQSCDYFTVQNSCVPDNKELLQSVRPYTPIKDYQSLYATFKDENVEGEGIYSAVIMDSKDVVFNGNNYGAWEINCIFTQWAPQGKLVDWAPVLAQVAQSFAYTDYYIQQWQQIAQSATSTPTSTISDTDPVMEAFEERSKSDTIIQEKRSDMLEEYERVYDNNTGEIYRAYNGFLDDMGDQNRYTPITDSQYTEGYVGWIDK